MSRDGPPDHPDTESPSRRDAFITYCHDPQARRRQLHLRIRAAIEDRYERDPKARIYGLPGPIRQEIIAEEEFRFIRELKQFLSDNPDIDYRQP